MADKSEIDGAKIIGAMFAVVILLIVVALIVPYVARKVRPVVVGEPAHQPKEWSK